VLAAQPGVVAVTLPSIASAEAHGTTTLVAGATSVAAVGNITSSEALGAFTLTVGAVSVLPTGIVSAAAVSTLTLNAVYTILGSSIGSEESFGPSVLVPGPVNITTTGVVSGAVVGNNFLFAGAVPVIIGDILSEEAIGDTGVQLNVALPPGVISLENVNGAILIPGPTAVSNAGGIYEGAIGSHTVIMGEVTVVYIYGDSHINTFIEFESPILTGASFDSPIIKREPL
jgi:hypothetical protein